MSTFILKDIIYILFRALIFTVAAKSGGCTISNVSQGRKYRLFVSDWYLWTSRDSDYIGMEPDYVLFPVLS